MCEQEPITYGFDSQKEVVDLFEAALTHRELEILQIIDFVRPEEKTEGEAENAMNLTGQK